MNNEKKDYKIERINVPNKLNLVNLKDYLADYKPPTQISNAEPIQTDSPNQVLYNVVGLNNSNKLEVEREIKKLFNEYICEQINCGEINEKENFQPFVHDDYDKVYGDIGDIGDDIGPDDYDAIVKIKKHAENLKLQDKKKKKKKKNNKK